MGESICDLIELAQKREDAGLLKLIGRFQPLLRKYARQLNYEDAYNDLQLAFIELVYGLRLRRLRSTTDATLVTYISKTIYNGYIQLSKKRRKYTSTIQLVEDVSQTPNAGQAAFQDSYTGLDVADMRSALTDREAQVTILHYYNHFSIHEIARMKRVSRQAINMMKRRSLKKLQDKMAVPPLQGEDARGPQAG